MGSGASKNEKVIRPKRNPEEKALISFTPWNNAQRALDPPSEKVLDDEIFESTVFDVNITQLEDDVIHNEEEEDMYKEPTGFVLMKRKKGKTEVLKHDDKFVELHFPLRLTRNMVVYIFHMKTAGKWKQKAIEKKVGSNKAEIHISDMKLESIFVTSRRIYDDVSLLPDLEYVYKNQFLKDEQVTFPVGSVIGGMNVKISTLSVNAKCKRERIKAEFGADPGIYCLSNVLFVDHQGKFNDSVTLMLKMDTLFKKKESTKPFVFHCDDDGVSIDERPIECISESKGLYRIEVDRFSGWGIGQGDKESIGSSISGLNRALDVGYIKCKILVFLLKERGFMSLWSEIVKAEEHDVEEARKRRRGEGLIELSKCRSQSILLKNFARIRVSIPKNVAIRVPVASAKEHQFIYFDRDSYENFLSIPIEKNERYAQQYAIVQYNYDKSEKKLCHQAHFPAYQYFISVSQQPSNLVRWNTFHCTPKSPESSIPQTIMKTGKKQQTKGNGGPVRINEKHQTESSVVPSSKGQDGKKGAEPTKVDRATSAFRPTLMLSRSVSNLSFDSSHCENHPSPLQSPNARKDSSHSENHPSPLQSPYARKDSSHFENHASPLQSPNARKDILCDKSLLILAKQMTVTNVRSLGVFLNLKDSEIDNLENTHAKDPDALKRCILRSGLENSTGSYAEKVSALVEGLEFLGLRNLSVVVESVGREGRILVLEDFEPKPVLVYK